MPVNSTTEDELKTAAEFTQIYNKWFRELVAIEENLLSKASEIQSLQNSLHSETDTLKNLNENLMQTQIELNYVEDLLNLLAKEQAELEREILKLNESTNNSIEPDSEDYEESIVLFESLESELKNVREKMKTIVQKINSNKDKCSDSENPFPIYRTILDHYTDALHMLDSNTIEMQQKFNTLHEMCLQHYIPSDIFSSPL